MITTLCVLLGEAKGMNKQVKRFCCCWAFVLSSQLLLVGIVLGGFAKEFRIEDWISYFFSTGYAIMYWFGVGWSGPMPISDGRWICGTVLLCGSSIAALLQKNLKLNFVLNVIFLIIHLIGCAFSFINMAGAVT